MDVVRTTKVLTSADVESAYRAGIFPMADPDRGIITWHRPKRRAILPLDTFHASHSLRALLRRRPFEITFDRAFFDVVDACADRPSTWISGEIKAIYGELHAQGKAHSVEVWVDGELAGGLYGVHLGGAFFAESMFHRRTNMSKVALAELVCRLQKQGFALLEVQYLTEHLAQFGVVEIPDRKYQARLKNALELSRSFWRYPRVRVMTYPVALLKTDEGYSVSCPELPGCCSQGATEEEALENIRSAIQEYLAAREEMIFSDPAIRRVEIAL